VIEKAIRTNPEVLAAISNRDASEKELDNAKAGRFRHLISDWVAVMSGPIPHPLMINP